MTGKIIIIITIIIIVVSLLFSPRFKHYKTQLPLQYIFFFHCGSFFAPWRVKRLRSFPATRPRRILCSLCCSSPLARRLSCASPLIVLLKKKKKKNPSRGNPHLACVRPFGTKPPPPERTAGLTRWYSAPTYRPSRLCPSLHCFHSFLTLTQLFIKGFSRI